MIIFPPPNDKELDVLQVDTTAQVHYATIPNRAPPSERGVTGLAQQLRDDLDFDDQPPAYEAQLPQGRSTSGSVVTNGDVKDPILFNDGREGIPRRSPPPTVSDRLNSPGGSGAARRTPVFEPLVMHSKNKKLQDGFFVMLPPTDIQPHPFTLRDVTESDWKKFLEDLQTSARLSNSPPSGERSNFFQNMGNMFRSLSANAVGKQPDQENHRGPAALVDTWNQNFFRRRGLEVILAKGCRRLNGDKSIPPPDCSSSESEGNDAQSRAMHGWPGPQSIPPVPPVPNVSPMAHMSPPVPPMPWSPSLPGGFMNGIQPDSKFRSHSPTSLSSDTSDSDSDTDSESDECRYNHGHTNSCQRPATCCCHAERQAKRAARRARREERREKRRERRRVRHDARLARKVAKWEAKLAARGFGGGLGMGMGPMNGGFGRGGLGCSAARGACPATMWGGGFGYRGGPMAGPPGGKLAFVQGLASLMHKEEDGYYRLIVIDRV